MKRVSFAKVGQSIKRTLIGAGYVLKQPAWAALAVIIAFLISLIIYLSINFGFYGSLLSSNLGLADKLDVIGVMSANMIRSYGVDLNGGLLLIVSLMQGAAITVLIFTAKRNRKMDAAVAGRSGLALVAATLGLGCVPCGTSLLIPVMTVLFSSSAPALMGTANAVILIVALLLTAFSLYKISQVAYKHYQAEAGAL